jgi:hypothetical protein
MTTMRRTIASCLLVLFAAGATHASAQTPAVATDAAIPNFADQVQPAAPDYALAANWAAGAAGPGASAAVPPGATPAATNAPVDVFYIHPTTYLSKTQWNQDVADAKTNAWTDASVIARQAGVFNACCKVYAPRYRQAGILNKNGGRIAALEFAYGDIQRAFDHYMKYDNHGRPFILAGHSQGGWLLADLLERRIDGTPLQKQMIAAYVVGIGVSEGDFGRRFKHLAMCDKPAQTGCVVQWNSVLPSDDLAKQATRYTQMFVDKYGDVPAKLTLCVNPLTFDRSKPSAPASASLGAVPGAPGEGALRPLVAAKVAAHCEQGLLVVQPDASLDLQPLPGGGVMHYHDFGLFYADIRANAMLRSKAFLAQHAKP